MEDRIKIDQIPSEPDEWFIKLYCKRKGVNNNETIEKARKSWTSLSDSKKKLFYKTIQNKNILHHAHGLSKSKIYMKEKPSKIQRTNSQSLQVSRNDITELEEQIEPSADEHLLDNTSLPAQENSFQTNTNEFENNTTNCEETQNKSKLNGYEEMEEAEEQDTLGPLREPRDLIRSKEDQLETQSYASSSQGATEVLVAPSPPTVKVGKEFYAVIKKPEDPSWIELPLLQKRRYNSAVRTLKRDYIRNYMSYLESLNQQQLFDHYVKTFY